MTVCKTVAFGLNKFESYHSHNGERPVGQGSCLENRLGVKASRVRISFSPLFPLQFLERVRVRMES